LRTAEAGTVYPLQLFGSSTDNPLCNTVEEALDWPTNHWAALWREAISMTSFWWKSCGTTDIMAFNGSLGIVPWLLPSQIITIFEEGRRTQLCIGCEDILFTAIKALRFAHLQVSLSP
jgi:hypothetical protein